MELAESGAPDVLGVVRFDPDDEAFDPADPSRSFQVRRTDRGALELHGIVSELQTWRVERRED